MSNGNAKYATYTFNDVVGAVRHVVAVHRFEGTEEVQYEGRGCREIDMP
jgi:hypothetical protein